MFIKRLVDGEERLIEITTEEKIKVLEELLSEVKEHLVILKDNDISEEKKRIWQD